MLPIIELDEVFYIGTFDKRNRRRSYEELALSVSRCPDRWKDGHLDPFTLRYPLWAIGTRGACFLDELTTIPNDREHILKDAELRGILKRANRLRVTTMFKDGESWYEDLHDPSNSKWANDKSVVKNRHVQRVQVASTAKSRATHSRGPSYAD